MDHRDLLIEQFDRVASHVDGVVDGLDAEQLAWSPAPDANSIGWLVWHLTRVQDHHLAELLDADQVWETGDWAERFGVEPDATNTGYGHTPEQVARIRADGPETLRGYYAAVAERMGTFLTGLQAEDLDRIVDERWDPPVTLGVRLVSILDDDIQHAGQAKFVRGLLLARPTHA